MKSNQKAITVPELILLSGIAYTTVLFAIYKYYFHFSKMDINIYEQHREVPYAKAFLLYVLIFMALGIIYYLFRKIKKLNLSIILIGLQVFLLCFSASIYLTKMNVIVEKALELVEITRHGVIFPFHNNFDLIWSSPSPLGKAVIIFAAAGIALLPLIIGFSYINRR